MPPRDWAEEALVSELSDASPERLSAFFDELAQVGTPVPLDGGRRSTFVFCAPAGTPAVHVRVNRVSDKHHLARGMMRQVPGTNVWVRTLPTGAMLRASYSFHLLETPEVPRIAPPPHGSYPGLLDPYARLSPLIDAGDGHGQSIMAGPLADPLPDWEAGGVDGVGGAGGHTLVAHPEHPWWCYLPPEGAAPRAHVVVFDAEKWFGRLGLADALTSAIARGALPPVTVTGVGFVSREDRLGSLRANDAFISSVLHGEIAEWTAGVRENRGVPAAARSGTILAGQSLGGLTALYALQSHADEISGVSAQSPSLWFSPGETAGPKALPELETFWITELLTELAERRPLPPIRLEAGLRERDSVVPLLRLGHELRARGVEVTEVVADGGHDYARWRGGLIDALVRLAG